MMVRSEQSLVGLRILVTRPAGQSEALAGEILKRGGEPVLFPVITIEDPESWEACDDALREVFTYDAIVVTSANAVDRLFGRAADLGLSTAPWRSMRWYAVGEATVGALKKQEIEAVTGDEATAQSLAQFLTQSDISGQRFLLPQGNRNRAILREMLEERGGLVDSVPVYRTVDATPETVHRVQRLLAKKAIDVVTFASPSAVRGFLRIIDRRYCAAQDREMVIAVIGPTTAEAATAEGLVPDIVASHSTAEGLATAIEHYYQKVNDE